MRTQELEFEVVFFVGFEFFVVFFYLLKEKNNYYKLQITLIANHISLQSRYYEY